MANTDIDGSKISILSENEARAIYKILKDIGVGALNAVEKGIIKKLARDLKL